MSPAEKAEVRKRLEWFQQLPEAQKQAMRQRWKALTPEQKERRRELFKNMSPEERKALRERIMRNRKQNQE
jgi:ferredoxin-NADP reductase